MWRALPEACYFCTPLFLLQACLWLPLHSWKTHPSHSTHKSPCGPCNSPPSYFTSTPHSPSYNPSTLGSSWNQPSPFPPQGLCMCCACCSVFFFIQLFARLGPCFLRILVHHNFPDPFLPLAFSIFFLFHVFPLSILSDSFVVLTNGPWGLDRVVSFAHVCIPCSGMALRLLWSDVENRNSGELVKITVRCSWFKQNGDLAFPLEGGHPELVEQCHELFGDSATDIIVVPLSSREFYLVVQSGCICSSHHVHVASTGI